MVITDSRQTYTHDQTLCETNGDDAHFTLTKNYICISINDK